MKDQAFDQLSKLLNSNSKLSELKAKGLGYDPKVGSWALGWSHYALAGDAKQPPQLDVDGKISIKDTKIGPDNTVADLISALKQNH